MKLYTYFRSTAAYRVRIALNLKGLDAELVPLNLVKKEHREDSYTAINPQALVPALVLDSGEVINQSMAILEYLEETHPEPALLPDNALLKSKVRSFAYEIASDLHPLNNLRVLKYLENVLQVGDQAKQSWYEHWIATAFAALEQRLSEQYAASDKELKFCFGSEASMADCLLIPQVYNAVRFNCDLEPYPLIRQINEHCLGLEPFAKAVPDLQPDAQ